MLLRAHLVQEEAQEDAPGQRRQREQRQQRGPARARLATRGSGALKTKKSNRPTPLPRSVVLYTFCFSRLFFLHGNVSLSNPELGKPNLDTGAWEKENPPKQGNRGTGAGAGPSSSLVATGRRRRRRHRLLLLVDVRADVRQALTTRNGDQNP